MPKKRRKKNFYPNVTNDSKSTASDNQYSISTVNTTQDTGQITSSSNVSAESQKSAQPILKNPEESDILSGLEIIDASKNSEDLSDGTISKESHPLTQSLISFSVDKDDNNDPISQDIVLISRETDQDSSKLLPTIPQQNPKTKGVLRRFFSR